MSAITLHRATEKDIPIFLSIEKKIAEERTYSALTDEKDIAKEIQNGFVYLIKDDDAVVGSISYEVREDGTVYLSGLVIDPACQGKGIGRQALNAVLAEVADAPRVELLTHPENIRALKLYESLGFKVESRHENYFGDGEPRVMLSRTMA